MECTLFPNQEEVAGATVAAIFDAIQSRRGDVAESLVFTALQLSAFQQPYLCAFLYASLAILCARRNDAKTALSFSRAVLKLRQVSN